MKKSTLYEEIKDIADKVNSEKGLTFDEVMQLIRDEATKGNYEIKITEKVSSIAVNELKQKGFRVDVFESIFSEGSIEVFWY